MLAQSLYQPNVIRQCHTGIVNDSATAFMYGGPNEPHFLTPTGMATTSQIRCAKKTSVLRKTAPLKVTFRVLTLHRLSPRLFVSQNNRQQTMSTARSRIDLSSVKNNEMKRVTIQITQSEFNLLAEACQITGHKPTELLAVLFRMELKPRLERTLSDSRKAQAQEASSQAFVEKLTAPTHESLRSAPLAPAAALNTPTPLGNRAPAPSTLPNTSSPVPPAPTAPPGMARTSTLLNHPTQTQPTPLKAAPTISPAQPPSATRSTPESSQ